MPVRLLMRSRYAAIDKIGNYKGPLLQVHGDADTIIPFELGRQLFDAANEPKQFVTIPGADHNDPRRCVLDCSGTIPRRLEVGRVCARSNEITDSAAPDSYDTKAPYNVCQFCASCCRSL